MQNYELLVILPGTLADNDVATEVEKVRTLIADNGGTNIEMGDTEKRRLAYPMKHIRYGYFKLFYFTAEETAVKVLESKFRIMPELLRALIQRVKAEGKKLKKINFGTLNFSEDGRRIEVDGTLPENVRVLETIPEVEPVVEVAEVIIEKTPEPIITLEEQKLAAAPVKKAGAKKTEKKKIDLDEIDKKLDEILDIELGNV